MCRFSLDPKCIYEGENWPKVNYVVQKNIYDGIPCKTVTDKSKTCWTKNGSIFMFFNPIPLLRLSSGSKFWFFWVYTRNKKNDTQIIIVKSTLVWGIGEVQIKTIVSVIVLGKSNGICKILEFPTNVMKRRIGFLFLMTHPVHKVPLCSCAWSFIEMKVMMKSNEIDAVYCQIPQFD